VITQIDLKLFKCFQILKLPVSPLTLLSGTNASGKSTVMQALVLLHQTILEHEWSTRLQLNGPELQLGNVSDVVDKVFGRREFGIGIVDRDCSVRWVFEYGEDKQAMSFQVASVECDGTQLDSPSKLRFLLPDPVSSAAGDLASRLKRLSYVTAERVGPRESYQLQDPSATQVVGTRGENAVGLLFLRREEHVHASLAITSDPPTLLKQTEARMKQFFPETSLIVQQVPQTNIVTLGLRTSDATDYHRPVNVGFGLTQVLPIIVAALSSRPGDLLLVENPEVHLHPAGQALMGQFLAQVAGAGVQVIVETHSDHVLNGIRRAVRSSTISSERVVLHFFTRRGEKSQQVTSPILDSSGSIDRWPEGFFDQFDKDTSHFAGWGE